MVEEVYKYWSSSPNFLNRDAKTLLTEMIDSDLENQWSWSFNINRAMNSLDHSLVNLIIVIQKFYQEKEKWENAQNSRASVIMANSTLNYHLLARHSVVLGYFPETEPLNRACFERMTRCVVSQLNEEIAKRFWKGKQIQQKQVRDLLSNHFEEKATGTGEFANDRIKNMYGVLSETSHPNLKSLQFRIYKPFELIEVNDNTDYIFGGEKQELLRLISIGQCMTYVIFSLFMLEIVTKKVFGTWSNVLRRRIENLYKEHDELFSHILGYKFI